jgi:hypothetical protein
MKLGFWMQDSSTTNKYSPLQFFNAYFNTPPNPAFLEMMIVGTKSSGYYWINQMRTWMDQLAALADSYPNIEIACMIGWDDLSDSNGWAAYQNFANMAKNHPSISILGMEGEYWTGATPTQWQQAHNISVNAGKKFISYYHPPSPYQEIWHTNFPGGNALGDFEALLDHTGSLIVGISNGYYYAYVFPDNTPLPINPTTRVYGHGWSQDVVNKAINHAVSSPYINRQYVSLCAGFSTVDFTGVSGLTTNCLWDNSVLRSWITSNPNYATHFQLGIGGRVYTFSITAVPTNGNVIVDGINKGSTPVQVILGHGSHTIVLGT